MQFFKTGFPGTGNSKLSKDHYERMISLNNIPITDEMIDEYFKFSHIQKCLVVLSDRPTKHRWGTAVWKKDKILLYRHSIGVFLHELAHIESYRRNKGIKIKPHGIEFFSVLEEIIDDWETTPFKQI
jgi:hypothetical protein